MQFGILLLNASGNDVAVMQMYMLEAVLMCFPVFLLFSYMFKMQSKQKNKITVLTESGEDEKEKWKALKNFMSEYSLISEKGMNDLVIWEKYLIFATAFGLSDKVIKEFKAKYKRVIIEEKWNESDIKEKFTYDNKYGIILPIFQNGIDTTIVPTLMKEKYLKEEISEKIRLFYVALTRAKEKMILILPKSSKEK